MKQKGKFVAEYWDKRARAEYAAKNPDSVLVQGPKAEFTSRYADPTHPASSGNLVSLVTGGHINPPSLRELRGGAAGVGERGIGMDGGFGGRGMGSRASAWVADPGEADRWGMVAGMTDMI
jgi:hypothetical protein